MHGVYYNSSRGGQISKSEEQGWEGLKQSFFFEFSARNSKGEGCFNGGEWHYSWLSRRCPRPFMSGLSGVLAWIEHSSEVPNNSKKLRNACGFMSYLCHIFCLLVKGCFNTLDFYGLAKIKLSATRGLMIRIASATSPTRVVKP